MVAPEPGRLPILHCPPPAPHNSCRITNGLCTFRGNARFSVCALQILQELWQTGRTDERRYGHFTAQTSARLWITRPRKHNLFYFGRMRSANARWAAAAAAAVLTVLALTSCQSAPTPVPTSTGTADAPVFASDEEALAAATDAYGVYLKASDDSWSGEGTTEEFLALSTGQAHEEDIAANDLYSDNGWRKTGHTKFDSMKFQSSSMRADGTWEVRTYLCLDVSETDVVDSSGTSVAPTDRPVRLPLEVSFELQPTKMRNLLVSESRIWSGSSPC